MHVVKVQFFTKDNCPLCEDAELLMNMLQREWGFEMEVYDIYKDDTLLEKYQLMIPVVVVNGVEVDFGQVSKEKIENYLRQQENS